MPKSTEIGTIREDLISPEEKQRIKAFEPIIPMKSFEAFFAEYALLAAEKFQQREAHVKSKEFNKVMKRSLEKFLVIVLACTVPKIISGHNRENALYMLLYSAIGAALTVALLYATRDYFMSTPLKLQDKINKKAGQLASIKDAIATYFNQEQILTTVFFPNISIDAAILLVKIIEKYNEQHRPDNPVIAGWTKEYKLCIDWKFFPPNKDHDNIQPLSQLEQDRKNENEEEEIKNDENQVINTQPSKKL